MATPYNPNIPQATDDPTDSQNDILQNFQALPDRFDVNHVALTDTSSLRGYHTKVYFSAPLGADPGLASPLAALYTKTVSGSSELFYQNGAAANLAKQLSNILPTTGGGTGTSYSWNFGDGIQVRMGTVTTANVNLAVTFNSAFSNTAYVCLVQPIGAAATSTAWNVQSLTTAGFALAASSMVAGSWYYLAIGR